MKKKVFSVILTSFMITTSVLFQTVNVYASENVKDPDNKSYLEEPQTKPIVTPETAKEKDLLNAKLNLSTKYYQNSTSSIIKGFSLHASSSIKVLNVPFYVEERGYFCGPASAYSAILSKKSMSTCVFLNDGYGFSQTWLATDLGTTTSGTNWTSLWTSTMNKYLPENNYVRLNGSSYSDWYSKLKSSVIYTVDKGYPVIADTRQDIGGIKLHPSYSYIDVRNTVPTYHYIVINGYNTSDSTFYITDSNSNSAVPAHYWTSISNVSSVSKPFGIVY